MRPVSKREENGIWIGEYVSKYNRVNRQDLLFDKGSSTIYHLIMDYSNGKTSERFVMEKIRLPLLKRMLESRIVQDFRYYMCPAQRFYGYCINVEKAYGYLIEKFGKDQVICYSAVAKAIESVNSCDNVIICPLSVPNIFIRVLNFNKSLNSSGIGKLKFIANGKIQIT